VGRRDECMLRRRGQAVLQTLGKHQGLVVLAVLLVLTGGGYTIATHETTSMEIIAWRTVMTWPEGQQRPPDVQVFDKIITQQPLVHDTKHQLDELERGAMGGCAIASPTYRYDISFATYGVPTEVYAGNVDCGTWTVTTFGVPMTVGGADGTSLYGYNLMTTLRKLTGMPLPSWWPG
jgi:hypothetical protein